MRKSIFVFIVVVLAVVGTVNKFDTVSCIFIAFVLLCTIVWYLTDKKKPQGEENAEQKSNGSEAASAEECIAEKPQTEEKPEESDADKESEAERIPDETNKGNESENEEK